MLLGSKVNAFGGLGALLLGCRSNANTNNEKVGRVSGSSYATGCSYASGSSYATYSSYAAGSSYATRRVPTFGGNYIWFR